MRALLESLIREYILAEKKKGRKKPGGGLTRMGALRKINPDQFKNLVRGAMRSAEGDVDGAADKIDVSTRRMYDYLNEPGLDSIKTAADLEREKEAAEDRKRKKSD